MTIPSSWRSDFYFVNISTDIYGNVFESDITHNNIKSGSFQVMQTLPDLVIKELNYSFVAQPTTGRILLNITNLIVANEGDAIITDVWTDSIFIQFANGLKSHIADKRTRKTIKKGQNYVINIFTSIVRQKYKFAQLQVLVDSSRVIYEKNDNNNMYTTPYSSFPQMFDDIEISNFTLLNPLSRILTERYYSGNKILMHVTYKNKQLFPTVTGWFDEFWLNMNGKEYLLDSFYISVLGGNKTVNKEVQVLFPHNTFGHATLVLKHDVRSNLIRSSSTPYKYKKQLYVDLPPSPDLKPKSITYLSTSDAVNSVQVSWSVENLGNAMQKILVWSDAIILSRSVSDPFMSGYVFLGSFKVSAKLQSEQIYSQTRDITIPSEATGNYYFHIVSDSINTIVEISGETNNYLSSHEVYKVPVPPVPELVVKNISISNDDDVVNSGDSFIFRYTIRNDGAVTPVSSWTDRIQMKESGKDEFHTLASIQHIGALHKNGGYSKTVKLFYPVNYDGGQYIIKVTTDINKKAAPSYEKKHFSVVRNITITAALKVDFKIFGNITNITAVAGQPLSIPYKVQNLGPGSQPNRFSWFDALYLSEDLILDPFDIKLSVLRQNHHLIVNASYYGLFAFNLPFDLPGRNYYLLLKTDSIGTVQDINTKNNIVTIQLKNNAVTFSSDIAVGNIKPPKNIEYGKTFSGTWDIINKGTQSISGYKCDSFYISKDIKWDLTDSELSTQCSFITLNGNKNGISKRSYSVYKPVPLVKQDHYYSVVKTRSNIKDFNLLNNEATSNETTLVVHDNLTLGIEMSIPHNNVNHGIWRIPNVPPGESLLVSVSSTNQLVGNEIFVRFREPASIETFDEYSGEFVSPNQTAVIKNTRKGEYYVFLRSILIQSSAISSQIKLLAKIAKFEINNVSPRACPPLYKHTTFKIDGSLFPSDYSIRFIDQSTPPKVVPPLHTYRFSSTLIYATLNMANFYYGDVITIEITNSISGEKTVFENAVSIIVGQIGSVTSRLNSPDAVRVGEEAQVSINTQNVGGTDILAPMFLLDISEEVILKVPSENKTIKTSNFLFMASSADGPAGFIAPGKSSHIEFNVVQIAESVRSLSISMRMLNTFDGRNHPYVKAKDSFRPSLLENRRWDPVWKIFLKHVGKNLYQFHQRLSSTLNHLSLLDDRVISMDELVKFELDLANGFHTGNNIHRVVDLQADGNTDLSIKILRYINPQISFRDVPGPFKGHGPFGKGWISPLW